MSMKDRDERIRAMLALRAGALEDAFLDAGHAPDPIDAEGVEHCRVASAPAWLGGSRTDD
ncbi:hypothetical protein PAI11_08650 [Patulibacter medicamentivorans]|uniref:Uncharacterized protein n=2 Tax=Patulibacter medicamentivorans TaxID=1097667 RepID=H0E252_9ACTN|nr:hypothetical protein PAI11_08650 [Patulibacter medicamentivorans]